MGKTKKMLLANGKDGKEGGGAAAANFIKPRDTWTSKAEFFLSCLGYAIGYGNLWRFPYLTYDCGGGAFLIAFLIMLITISMPMFFIELALAQYASCGPAKLYRKLTPLLGGVGIAMVFNSVLIFLYYNMIIGWALYFLYIVLNDSITASISNYRTTRIMWTTCDNDYNTAQCYVHCHNSSSRVDCSGNSTAALVGDAISPAEEFFYNKVLNIADSIDGWSWPLPHLVAVLAVSWLACFLCLCRGIKSSGKVVWVTATVPYLLLLVLFIRGMTIPGHAEGIRYYIEPNVSRLMETEVWIKAAGQVLYSTAVGGGGLGTYASYNHFHNNVFGDALIVPAIDFGTSVFGGFVVFAFIGFLARTLNRPVREAVREGTALVFIAYPEAVGQMNYAVAWAVAFNLLMLFVGIDSQFAMIEIATTAMMDEWPRLRQHKSKLFASVCACGCVLGIVLFTTRTGYFWLSLIDYFVAGWPLLFFGLCENLCILAYGVDRFSDDVYRMTGRRCNRFMKICWRFICPTALGVLLVLSCVRTVPIRYKGVPYTLWAQIVGWGVTLLNISMVPVYAVYVLLTRYTDRPLMQRVKLLLKSTPEWDALADRHRNDKGSATNGAAKANGHHVEHQELLLASTSNGHTKMSFAKNGGVTTPVILINGNHCGENDHSKGEDVVD